MPNRIVRDDLLDSARYWAATVDERQLYLHLILSADDFGLVTLAPVFVRRRCFGEDPPTQKTIDAMLTHLKEVDLIRTYENAGARYAFIPRFRQKLRIEKAKHPMPPDNLFADDEHAKAKFLENKEKFQKMHSIRGAPDVQPSGTRTAEVEVKGSEVKGIEEKGREEKAAPAAPAPQGVFPESQEVKNGGEPNAVRDVLDRKAEELGLKPFEGENRFQFAARVASFSLQRTARHQPADPAIA
jgi:hypothetical protein